MPTMFSKEAIAAYLPPIDELKEFFEANKKLITLSNLLKLFGIGAAGFSAVYIIKVWWSYKFFFRRGLKTPKFRFFVGNFPEIKNNNQSDVLREWTKQFGPTFGYFEGHLPILVTSDLDIIQEVFIKQYSNFSARKRGPVSPTDNYKSVNLFNSTQSRWKRMRNIMNPTFSTAKLKELSPLINKCVDRLNTKIGEKDSIEINVADYFKRFTMDTIWNCAFGVDINLQFDKTNDGYYQKCEQIFKNAVNFPPLFYIATYMHEFKATFLKLLLALVGITKILGISSGNHGSFLWLRDRVSLVVKERQNGTNQRNDYMKLLLDAQTESTINDTASKGAFSSMHVEKKLSILEIETNLVMFMLAGYETTSTALTYASYVLARYPEEQETLYNEIISNFLEKEKEPEIDTVSRCEYLDMFIKELLRLYPIGNSVINRRCVKSTTLKGIQMPVDLVIAVDVMSVHFNADLWGPVDPNEFYPKRHLPEFKRHPLAFMGFGIGPRNCIGMKFALQELKFALVKMMRSYEIRAGQNTPTRLEITEGIVRRPKDGVNVVFKKRN